MSALAGVLARGGTPVDSPLLATLSAALEAMGPDGEHVAHGDVVDLLVRPFHTTVAPQLGEYLAACDGFLVTVDGRIDNAADVRRALGRTDLLPAAHLVLAAYRRWGVEGFGRLIGDFAVALWDASERRLVLAADSLGRRPLYYHVGPTRVLWASACLPLVDAAQLPIRLDDEYVASYLTNRPSLTGPIAGISIVPGGHALVVEGRRHTLTRYWAFDPEREIRLRDDAEYEEEFRSLLSEAIAARMDGGLPVWCELSGGLDSSSIACIGERLRAEGRVRVPAFPTVSYVFGAKSTSDEERYISAVEAQLGRPGWHVSDAEHPIYAPLPDGFVSDFPTSQLCFLGRQDFVTRAMRDTGARVLLCGIGGDQLFWSQPPFGIPLADQLAQGRFVALARDATRWARAARMPLWRALFAALFPLTPMRWRARRQRIEPLNDWIDPSFAHRTALRERFLGMPDDVGFRLPSRVLQYGLVRRTMRMYALEWCTSEGCVDIRYPYLDRRLVEFALAIPLEQSIRLGESRSLVRRALRGILPEVVRERRSKAGPAEAMYHALRREWPRLGPMLQDPYVAADGFVSRDAFVAALDRARYGHATNQGQLVKTIALELWLRSLMERHRRQTRVGAGVRARSHAKSTYPTTSGLGDHHVLRIP